MGNLFDPLHEEFLRLLNKREVAYILIGGYAVNIHGYSRTTGDIDIWIKKGETNLKKVIEVIEEFGYDGSVLYDFPHDEILMFSLGSREEAGHIELTNQIAGISFDDAYNNIEIHHFNDIPVKIIHYNDLIKNKIASGRKKDLDDIENLTAIKKKSEERLNKDRQEPNS